MDVWREIYTFAVYTGIICLVSTMIAAIFSLVACMLSSEISRKEGE